MSSRLPTRCYTRINPNSSPPMGQVHNVSNDLRDISHIRFHVTGTPASREYGLDFTLPRQTSPRNGHHASSFVSGTQNFAYDRSSKHCRQRKSLKASPSCLSALHYSISHFYPSAEHFRSHFCPHQSSTHFSFDNHSKRYRSMASKRSTQTRSICARQPSGPSALPFQQHLARHNSTPALYYTVIATNMCIQYVKEVLCCRCGAWIGDILQECTKCIYRVGRNGEGGYCKPPNKERQVSETIRDRLCEKCERKDREQEQQLKRVEQLLGIKS